MKDFILKVFDILVFLEQFKVLLLQLFLLGRKVLFLRGYLQLERLLRLLLLEKLLFL